jgi:N-acetylglutamate synthase-like GNAT family acetyltransferase
VVANVNLEYMSEKGVLNEIIKIRKKWMCATTPKGVPYLKEKTYQELRNLLDTTLILVHKNQIAGTICIQPFNAEDAVASIGSFICDQNGYGRKLLVSALQRTWHLGYRSVISLTASDKAKRIFEQYGTQSADDRLLEYLETAKKRYGSEEHLAQLFVFHESRES